MCIDWKRERVIATTAKEQYWEMKGHFLNPNKIMPIFRGNLVLIENLEQIISFHILILFFLLCEFPWSTQWSFLYFIPPKKPVRLGVEVEPQIITDLRPPREFPRSRCMFQPWSLQSYYDMLTITLQWLPKLLFLLWLIWRFIEQATFKC